MVDVEKHNEEATKRRKELIKGLKVGDLVDVTIRGVVLHTDIDEYDDEFDYTSCLIVSMYVEHQLDIEVNDSLKDGFVEIRKV